MQKPIINYSLSANGNPWWVANHMSCVAYEVQINQSTGSVLMGMGMVSPVNRTITVEELLEDRRVQSGILMNFNQETLEHILRICDETRTDRK